jgi:hypothetical protein
VAAVKIRQSPVREGYPSGTPTSYFFHVDRKESSWGLRKWKRSAKGTGPRSTDPHLTVELSASSVRGCGHHG